MKKKIFTRVLALLGAIITVVSVAIVPTFADIWTDSVRTQKVSLKLGETWTDSTYGGYSNDSYILYRAGSKVIWFDYDYQKGVNGVDDKYKNVMCEKLLFDFDYERYGSEGAALIDTSCSVYADDRYLFTIVRRGTELATDDYDMLYVAYADGTTVYWEGSETFDVTFYVRHEWLSGMSVHGAQVSNSYYNPFSFFGRVQTSSPSQYEQGYNEGLSVGYSDGYEDGQSNGNRAGYEQGYTEGETAGYNSGYTDGYDKGSMDGYFAGYEFGFAEGESLHADDWQYGYDLGYLKGTDDGYFLGVESAGSYYNDYWSVYYNSEAYGNAVQESIKSNDSNPVTAFFNSMWNGLIDAYDTVTQNVSVSGVSLAMVITTIILAIVVIWLVKVLTP